MLLDLGYRCQMGWPDSYPEGTLNIKNNRDLTPITAPTPAQFEYIWPDSTYLPQN